MTVEWEFPFAHGLFEWSHQYCNTPGLSRGGHVFKGCGMYSSQCLNGISLTRLLNCKEWQNCRRSF